MSRSVDGQGLLGHVGPVGVHGGDHGSAGASSSRVMQSAMCRPGLAALGLDQADDVAGRALGLELVVDGGVEGHHAHVAGQGAALVGVAGPQHELVLARLEA